jgi:hypothetical protein
VTAGLPKALDNRRALTAPVVALPGAGPHRYAQ